MMDESDNAFVAVRWYKEKETFPVDAVLELPALQLASAKRTASYSVMPVHCIVNGALLIKCGGTSSPFNPLEKKWNTSVPTTTK